METFCSNCGQNIKNVIFIKNRPFGTTCAEIEIGGKLPRNFKGDYDTYIKKHTALQGELTDRLAQDKNRIIELWDDAKILDMAWRTTNDWGRDFLISICNQLGYSGLLNVINTKKYGSAENYINSDHVKEYGLFANKFTRSISQLSERQRQIINNL